ncbi:MAG: redoxin domain-containing protein, partial [Planctomycetota bacterium]|nr:redoxin domain-containing protein [Planctomycetota bacterium]
MMPASGPAANFGALFLGALLAAGSGCAPEPAGTVREPATAASVSESVELKILGLIQAQWPRLAVERCREQIAEDPHSPMPRALMALATWWEPNRAARCCWEAIRRREHGTAHQQQIVDALQDYFMVKDQPELVDERFRDLPTPARAGNLARRLQEVAANDELQPSARDRAVTKALLEWARERAGPRRSEPDVSVDELEALLRHHNAYLQRTGAMPFEVSGYQRVVQILLAKKRDNRVHAGDGDLPAFDGEPQFSRVPRHPELSRGGLARRMPGWVDVGPEQWQPKQATGFELPAGIGGTRVFTPGDGKPKLVVFFLGFGCAHCVAQLKDLDPKAAAFRDAGIEVLSIGTDSYQEVLAAQQASVENGVDPLHFDVLCDPAGEVF